MKTDVLQFMVLHDAPNVWFMRNTPTAPWRVLNVTALTFPG